MLSVAPPIYDSEVNELTVFPNLKAARDWLINNKLDTSGTSILVPFKDENDKVHFLRPFIPSTLSKSPDEINSLDANKDIRIMGAANDSHVHGFIEKIKAALIKNRVPHLNELVGDTISLVDHGFIVIYKKGETKAGHQFVKLFEEERQSLLDKIKAAQTNEEPQINAAEFLEKLSTLALELDIKVGMTYFVTNDKNGSQHVYRHIFKQDPTNIKTERYLEEESKWHESKRVKVKEHKSRNHHIIPFLIDWCKWTVFAAITAIGAGLILGIFITPPLGTIVAAVVAVATFVGMSSIGFAKADKNNPATIVFGTPEFEVESEASFFSRIKQRINSLRDFFGRKSTVALSTANVSSETTGRAELFTTAIDAANESNSACATLVKSSFPLSLLFKLAQENDSTEGNHLHNIHSFRN